MARRDFGSIIRKPGSSKYYVRFRAGRGSARKRYDRPAGPTKEIAKRMLLRVQALLADGHSVEQVLHDVFGDPLPGRLTFREVVPPYLEYAEANRKPNTVYGYRKLLDQICREPWAAKLMDEIERVDIVRWMDARAARKELSPQTINNGLAVTSAVFRWALSSGVSLNAIPSKASADSELLAAERRISQPSKPALW